MNNIYEMEKLIMLLDIYEEEVVGIHSVGDKITEKDESWICSKKFGFIKWLVDDDKIRKDIYRPIPLGIKVTYEGGAVYHDKLEDRIIMLLSISDTPIDDLISYLR